MVITFQVLRICHDIKEHIFLIRLFENSSSLNSSYQNNGMPIISLNKQ